jgi:hypothetical protein
LAGLQSIKTWGKREGNSIVTKIKTGRKIITRNIPLEKDDFSLSTLSPFLFNKKLKVGEVREINIFNPIFLESSQARIEILKTENIEFMGKKLKTFVIKTQYKNMKTKSWITESGIPLKEEMPSLGWTMIKEPKEKATKLIGPAKDFLNLYAVKTNKIIRVPRKIKYLKIKIEGAPITKLALNPSVQKIDEKNKIVEISAADIKINNLNIPINNPEFKKYLKGTAFVQVNDEKIKKRAVAIIRKEKNAWECAKKISNWVNKVMIKTPNVGIPSALEILNQKRGDCNEHTVLFTALARSVGIPTEMCAGIAYQQGKFYYHAWPKVYVGQWVSMDPTFNQTVADATHIELINGDLSKQMKILPFIGKLKVDIMEYK